MAVNVVGILKHPLDGGVGNAVIRVTAQDSIGSIKGLEGKFTTGSDGAYDFLVVDGVHNIEINFSDQYHEAGLVTISTESNPIQDLQELLNG